MTAALSSTALRRGRRGLGSFIDGVLEGDPLAITMLVMIGAGVVGVFVLLTRHKEKNDGILEQDAQIFGRDMALVRRAAREQRAGYELLSIVWLGIGAFVGVSLATLSPMVALICFALSALAAGWCKFRQSKVPDVDDHPIVVLARDRPRTVTSASYAADRGVIHLTLVVDGPDATCILKLDPSWGAELIERLPHVFPHARFVRAGDR